MGVKAAVIDVLKEAGGPLHATAITERILSRGLWQTTGKTPVATVCACLYSDIKKRGNASAFVLTGPRTFGLRELGARSTTGDGSDSAKLPEKSPTRSAERHTRLKMLPNTELRR